jgi:hypothetical protein
MDSDMIILQRLICIDSFHILLIYNFMFVGVMTNMAKILFYQKNSPVTIVFVIITILFSDIIGIPASKNNIDKNEIH